MKDSITTHCESEHKHGGKYCAFRLRIVIEGELYCTRPNKRRAAQLHRKLWLFNSLTRDDAPNWNNNNN